MILGKRVISKKHKFIYAPSLVVSPSFRFRVCETLALFENSKRKVLKCPTVILRKLIRSSFRNGDKGKCLLMGEQIHPDSLTEDLLEISLYYHDR